MINSGMLNIGSIAGLLTKVYKTSDYYITIMQDGKGSLRTVIVDDGCRVNQYDYEPRKMRKSGSNEAIQRRTKY